MTSKINIYNSDCLPSMEKITDNKFDLAIVDPPFGINRDTWDNKPSKEYWDQLFRISKNQIVFGGNYFELPITESWLCWDKTNNGKSFFKHKAKFELIWLSIPTKPDFIRYTLDGNVTGWNAKPDYNKHKAIHSCQKPVPVYKYLLKNYAKPGDKILDTHFGSLSIGIACWDYGYDLDAFEIDRDYFEAGKKRLDVHRAQLQINYKQ